jgi:prepilin-type N-terminal cleavage/methylation domain-containing protein
MKAPDTVRRSSGMRGRHGLTLVEVLIALMVIGVAFWALASAQIGSLRSTAKASEISEAKTFANRVLEDRRREITTAVLNAGTTIAAQQAEWDKYAGGTCGVPAFPPPSPNNLCGGTETHGIYTAEWVLGRESGNQVESEGLIQVLLRVNWTQGGTARSLGLMDYISCGHINLSSCPDPFDPAP